MKTINDKDLKVLLKYFTAHEIIHRHIKRKIRLSSKQLDDLIERQYEAEN